MFLLVFVCLFCGLLVVCRLVVVVCGFVCCLCFGFAPLGCFGVLWCLSGPIGCWC